MNEIVPTQPVDHVVMLIHGIRTHASWAEMASAIIEAEGLKTQIVRYGFFDTLRFLSPFITRRKAIDRIVREYRDVRYNHPGAKISVIAHSFGTYAILKTLDEPDIVFHRIVLCGSIVPDDFRLARYRSQVTHMPILNDCGTHDIWPVLAKSSTWGYGATGTFGFGTAGIRDRFSKFTHSAYFDRSFITKYWVPFLTRGEIVPTDWESERTTPPYWQSLLNLAQIKWVVPLAALLLGAWGGGAFEPPPRPSLAVERQIYVGQWLGMPSVFARFHLRNPGTAATRFLVTGGGATGPDGTAQPLGVEVVNNCNGLYPTTQQIIVPPRSTMTCDYFLLGDLNQFFSFNQKINKYLLDNRIFLAPFPDASKPIFAGALLDEMKAAAARNFRLRAGTWRATIAYTTDEMAQELAFSFGLNDYQSARLKEQIEHVDAGYGVILNWRNLDPNGAPAMQGVNTETASH